MLLLDWYSEKLGRLVSLAGTMRTQWYVTKKQVTVRTRTAYPIKLHLAHVQCLYLKIYVGS